MLGAFQKVTTKIEGRFYFNSKFFGKQKLQLHFFIHLQAFHPFGIDNFLVQVLEAFAKIIIFFSFLGETQLFYCFFGSIGIPFTCLLLTFIEFDI